MGLKAQLLHPHPAGDGQAQVLDPVFRVYVNGTLAEEIPGEVSQGLSSSSGDCYAPATQDQRLEIPCTPGDTVEVKFFCRDSYGLGYEFSIIRWSPISSEATSPNLAAPGEAPALTWPE